MSFLPPKWDGKRAGCNNLPADLDMGDELCWCGVLEKAVVYGKDLAVGAGIPMQDEATVSGISDAVALP